MNRLDYQCLSKKDSEICVANLRLKKGACMFVICVYRIPDSDPERLYESLYSLLDTPYEKENIYIVCGDFNINFLKDSKFVKKYINLFAEFDMEKLYLSQQEYLRNYNSFYFPTVRTVNTHKVKKRLINERSCLRFRECMLNANWDGLERGNLNEKFNFFHGRFVEYYETSFPEVAISYNQRKKIPKDLKQFHSFLNEMHRLSKHCSEFYKNRYEQLEYFYGQAILRRQKDRYNRRVINCDNLAKES
ncbi:hypothetical protein HHI36_018497 [Cryptolaemus montrouzieri]|uniref:Endonuclease/exonuclease/phosphatase domain-containing protein n=1 Tax=Cryptolaemus montrouzieri TaxID=559131 RepID=A0ABD2P0G0_9CUCU